MVTSIENPDLVESLPYLRRYARALAGNQQSGDTAVVAAVRSLSVAPVEGGRHPRVALFQIFTDIWNGPAGAHIRGLSGGPSEDSNIARKLSAIPSQARQVFLLQSVEGFDNEQVADILRITAEEVAGLQERANETVTNQVATDVLIIEDEQFIAADLEDIVTSSGHTVISVERTHASAAKALQIRKPGLVLADVQLADGSSGLDAASEILAHCEVPIIFITAYPERLLTGLRVEPTFVLTKPFKRDTVKAVINQALFFEANAQRIG